MRALAEGVDARVGAAGPEKHGLFPHQFGNGLLRHLLHGEGVFLPLPAGVIRAVVFEGEQDSHQNTPSALNSAITATSASSEGGAEVVFAVAELAQARAALAAVVAARLHGHGQFVRAAKGADKQRHQKRHHRLRAAEEVAGLKIRAARHLRLHDLVRFFHQRGDEAQGDGHHHGDLMGGKAQARQGAHEAFHAVGQGNGRGGQRQKLRGGDQQHQPHGEEGGAPKAHIRHRDELPGKQRRAFALKKNVEQERERHDIKHRPEPANEKARMDLRHARRQQNIAEDDRKPRKPARKEHRYDQPHGPEQLRARVQAGERRNCRENTGRW